MPYSLSEDQIDFILADIKKRGIEIEKLQINLLDHICCLLEEKMKEGDDFETNYKTIIEDFHENGLKGIQKETKGLVRNKYYYRLKLSLYIIFAGSITYNTYIASRIVRDIIQHTQEVSTIKGITIKEGHDYMMGELKKTYPERTNSDFFCIHFMEPLLNVNHETWFPDSVQAKNWLLSDIAFDAALDSLAKIYTKKVCFVNAFERTDDQTEKYIEEQKQINEHLCYLSGMNKVFSGYNNYRKVTYKSYPTIFIVDKHGILVYDGYIGYDILNRLSLSLKKLKERK